jgi:hypothetical protein
MFRFNFSLKNPDFQGDLAVVTIEHLMQLLSHAGLSGELQLKTSHNAAVFFVHNGTLVYSYLEKKAKRVGRMLVEKNLITEEHLHECLAQYKWSLSKPKIGTLLVEKKYVSRDDLETVVREQIKENFFEVLTWKAGSFIFTEKEVPEEEDIFLDSRIDHLILQGIIHHDEQSRKIT